MGCVGAIGCELAARALCRMSFVPSGTPKTNAAKITLAAKLDEFGLWTALGRCGFMGSGSLPIQQMRDLLGVASVPGAAGPVRRAFKMGFIHLLPPASIR
jgi:hypothetical protein